MRHSYNSLIPALLLLLLLLPVKVMAGSVRPGIEVLRDNDFSQLRGKRVGLITNPTGVDNNLRSTIDILHEAPGWSLWPFSRPSMG